MSYQQTIAANPPMAFAPFGRLINDLITGAARYDSQRRAERQEADAKTLAKASAAAELSRKRAAISNAKKRKKIMAILAKHGVVTSSQMAAKLGAAGTSSTNRHLKEMADEGLVKKGGGQSKGWKWEIA